jgi:hypothetical protein
MSKPAKDEAELVEQMAMAMTKHFSMNNAPHMSGNPLNRLGALELRRLNDATNAALAAIRAAGWAVVPVALLEEAAFTLESLCDIEHIHRDKYPDEQRRYARDMEFPQSIRAMLAAAPGVKS